MELLDHHPPEAVESIETRWDNYGHKPFLDQAQDTSKLVTALARDFDQPYQLSYELRVRAMQNLLHFRPEESTPKAAATTHDDNTTESVLSKLLLQYIKTISTSPASCEIFLQTFDQVISGQGPFTINLSLSEYAYYTKIAETCEQFCAVSYNQQDPGLMVHVPTESKSLLRENLVRFWLGLGSIQESIQAVNFLLTSCPAPLRISAFLSDWRSCIDRMKKPVLRVSWRTHFADLSGLSRVNICSSSSDAEGSGSNTKAFTGRKWDWKGDSGWDRYNDRVSSILEEAYQARLPWVDFTVDGNLDLWRADLEKMVQRNISSGKERPLRSLLALVIRDKCGRLSQSVEINMTHDTLIEDLRKEVASYLKHGNYTLFTSHPCEHLQHTI
jgi:hypothetical protein